MIDNDIVKLYEKLKAQLDRLEYNNRIFFGIFVVLVTFYFGLQIARIFIK